MPLSLVDLGRFLMRFTLTVSDSAAALYVKLK